MKSYETIKTELKSRRKNIKGYNKQFYNTFKADLGRIQKASEEADRKNERISIAALWKESDTHKSYFYQYNGSAYCEFLELI